MLKYSLAASAAFGLLLLSVASAAPTAGAAKKPPAQAAAPAPKLPSMTAAQVADRNADARGGLAAWKAIKTLSMTGKFDAGGKERTLLPFTLQQKRPHKERFTIDFAEQTSVQVYDGEHGWKYRPYLGRDEVEPFSADEEKSTAAGPEIDGLLIDYAAKGSTLALDGTDLVDGKAAYRLKVTTKSGVARHVWVDGTTFLESKFEGEPRHFDGKMHNVYTYPRDYKAVSGLMFPFTIETRLEGAIKPHSMTIESVVVNPKLDDSVFTKPTVAPPAKPAAKPAASGAAPAAPAKKQ